MKVDICSLMIKTDKEIKVPASKIRGYIGNQFKDKSILHNHYGNERFLYSYPLVQYKIINGQPLILGVGEGAKVLKDISSDLYEFKLDKNYLIWNGIMRILHIMKLKNYCIHFLMF